MYLIFDTETTGLPRNYNAPFSDSENWPRCVQIAWQLHAANGDLIEADNLIVKPNGFTIPYSSIQIHGITNERAQEEGKAVDDVLERFKAALERTQIIVGHNIEFDINIMGAELFRLSHPTEILASKKTIDTKEAGTNYCAISGGKGGKFKWPTLTELHEKLFGKPFDDAHDAAYDVDATARCFFGLIKESVIPTEKNLTVAEVNYEAPKLDAANFAHDQTTDKSEQKAESRLKGAKGADISVMDDLPFAHLHTHSQFSILQATTEIEAMTVKAKETGVSALALTDHGNMMGTFNFVKSCFKQDIIPIVGCEFNLCHNHKDKSHKDNGFQLVVLAKNKNGFHNLAKLSSISYIDGFYYLPRIDKELLKQYKEDLIVLTGGVWGEIPDLILNVGEEKAEEAFLWYKEVFGNDFYVELNRHGLPEEEIINEVLIKFARKHSVKLVAANSSYYLNKVDAQAHDVLLCVKDGESVNKPKKYIGRRGRDFRFGFPNDEFYIKSPQEMKKLFHDLPEAIENISEIINKITTYKLERDVLLPKFDIPKEFQDIKDLEDGGTRGENNYLRHLTYVGAKKRYGEELSEEVTSRLDFELEVIANTGYPGYFLIVQDFTTAAREMGVSVGPGRGSAAGSAVAYCIGITNVDPIAYDLLFERFLNPERVSLPDIDIDFDDEGRQKVIDYVIKKYGANQVAQIITYGSMAAKSAIRDTARVMDLPLSEADTLAKLLPDNTKLKKVFSWDEPTLRAQLKNKSEDIEKVKELKRIAEGNSDQSRVVNQARKIEGSVRNTGIHACGVIITPDDITKFVPVALAKDSDMYCTQFDNAVVEDAGLLKMDFLGLKTLTLIKDTVRIVEERHGIKLDPEAFPIDDQKTYELFQRGETVGIFQYESDGMQKYMKELKPTEFSDLIAMNALYRPGPLEYIPNFIRRKHGEEEIVYDLPEMKELLEETYGITVYQEQVMRLSQLLAGFSKGEADMLRKAMGKKIKPLLEKLKPEFVGRGEKKGHPKDKLEKIWKDWEAFASYAFNKSHSTCYAWVAYQTAYLKAHYPAEYIASVLSNNMNDIKQVTFFMTEAKRMGIKVMGPHVNQSQAKFSVDEEGNIRFGLAAIKGTGNAAVDNIIEEREKTGPYKDLFDFAKRVNLRAVNKKTFESLAQGGGFDCWPEYHRRQYLYAEDREPSLIEKAVRYAGQIKAEIDSSQQSLFGGDSGVEVPLPKISNCEPYTKIEELRLEKEVIGLFLSGHPLDQYKYLLKFICNSQLDKIVDMKEEGINVSFGGIISTVRHTHSKTGNPMGLFELQDYTSEMGFFLFGEKYGRLKHFMVEGNFLFIKGKTKRNFRDASKMEVDITDIELLSEVKDKYTKSLSIKIDVDAVNEEFMILMDELCQKHPGSCSLKINLHAASEKIDLELLSRSIKIDPNNDLLSELEKHNYFDFQLN
ncbi:MAG: DNA polymerase III subunit alpha [Cyclobacteriaceae bacterium]|nr:DNA polymerase III subunit alpha [Cyclobacteriaceae bacterium]MCH8516479.1 DNA polymerase III subunit alpha [Cyclobacteriaceae bacterium]